MERFLYYVSMQKERRRRSGRICVQKRRPWRRTPYCTSICRKGFQQSLSAVGLTCDNIVFNLEQFSDRHGGVAVGGIVKAGWRDQGNGRRSAAGHIDNG